MSGLAHRLSRDSSRESSSFSSGSSDWLAAHESLAFCPRLPYHECVSVTSSSLLSSPQPSSHSLTHSLTRPQSASPHLASAFSRSRYNQVQQETLKKKKKTSEALRVRGFILTPATVEVTRAVEEIFSRVLVTCFDCSSAYAVSQETQ